MRALRRSRDLEHEAFSIAQEREIELRQLQSQAVAQPELLKAQWKSQMSQQATKKAEIHALHTEIANTNAKSELQAPLSAKMCSIESLRPIVENLRICSTREDHVAHQRGFSREN